tara:strand:+ start:289 stop:492 length:204 start_codon:yes stop_codon:yes gene_type:complete
MAQIRIYNSAHSLLQRDMRFIDTKEVTVQKQGLTTQGKPYIMFEHEDYPLGALMAIYDGAFWQCDLD